MKYLAFKQKIKKLPIFSTSFLGALTDQPKVLQVQLADWKKKGLVESLRKGLCVLSREERETEPSLFYLANQIYVPSYISLESALTHYGLIPEFTPVTTSVTVRNTRRFENSFGVFVYQHVSPNGFGGFVSVRESAKLTVLIALPEKPLLIFSI